MRYLLFAPLLGQRDRVVEGSLPVHRSRFRFISRNSVNLSRIGAESIRCRAKLLHAVRSIFAGALQLGVSHGNYVVDSPRPALKLNADRADLDLIAAIANDNPIVVARPRAVLFAQKQVHGPMIPPIRGKVKPQGLGRA
jgi:hypothetical protein